LIRFPFPVKKLLKIGYPPPPVVALRRFYGYATAIFEDFNYRHSPKYITTCKAGGFLSYTKNPAQRYHWFRREPNETQGAGYEYQKRTNRG
jgi:hypothetical protein